MTNKPTPTRRTPRLAVKVDCLECGRKFTARSSDPACPKCGGVDIDVREVA